MMRIPVNLDVVDRMKPEDFGVPVATHSARIYVEII